MFKTFFAKKSYTPVSNTYMVTPYTASWTPRRYDQFAKEAFMYNVIAYRAITLIAQAIASVPWQLYKEDKLLNTHPVLTLLDRPQPHVGGKAFIESVVTQYLLSGNVYLLAIKEGISTPRELHLLRPDRVEVMAGKNGQPKGYRYTIDNYTRNYYIGHLTGKSEILHLKRYHPLNDWYGLSPMEPASYSIDQHNQACSWNQSILQNGARPCGALIFREGVRGRGGTLSEEQFEQLQKELIENFSGAKNAGRPMLLEGGLEWREMGMHHKDMDFIENKNTSAREIALAFGVPPQLLGIPGDNTYSNLAEARLALWEQTIIPLLSTLSDAFNHWLLPYFGKQLHLSHDLDAISALAPRREKIWDRIKEADFMTTNEKRKAVGLPPLTEKIGSN